MARFLDKLKLNGLDGYIISHEDEYRNEYLPSYAERLAYLTGFTGSAGWAILTFDRSALFIDGRYSEQAKDQTQNGQFFNLYDIMKMPPSKWLASEIESGRKVGYSPLYLTVSEARKFQKACGKSAVNLIPCLPDLVDETWNENDRPVINMAPIFLYNIAYSGQSVANKLKQISCILEKKSADAALLTVPDTIAWTLNIRGRDIAHNPVPLCFALIKRNEKSILWIEDEKISPEVQKELSKLVEIHRKQDFSSDLTRYAQTGNSIIIDPQNCPELFYSTLKQGGAHIIETSDPITSLKACKNNIELTGMRRAQLRDGVAMVKFLCWLDNQPPDSVTEINAAQKLEHCRRKTAKADGSKLMDLSFDTISAAGAHAALPHYRVLEHHNWTIPNNSFYLVDSGGQYLDGTTDITRTVVIGSVDSLRKMRYTQVLKGHIALAQARFPKGTTGAQLDTIARSPLWHAGCDYGHGTGHGVGAYLCVHEGPARISKTGHTPLELNMVLSNEPGYYKPGNFGIRLENLLIVINANMNRDDELPMLAFETITFCPFDLRAIDPNLLCDHEKIWLNNYHAETYEKLAATNLLLDHEKNWLSAATTPLKL